MLKIFFILSFSFFTFAVSGKTVEIGVSAMQEKIDPVKAWHYLHYEILAPCIQTLVSVDPGGKIFSGAGRKWKVESNGKKYTFFLDKKIKFHNGKPLTAADVAFSINRAMLPKHKSLVGDLLRKILNDAPSVDDWTKLPKSIEIIDEHTIAFHLKTPYPSFLTLLSNPSFAIIDKSTIGTSNLVFSGDYRIMKESPVKLSMLPVHDDSLPKFIVRLFRSDEEMLKSLHQGKVDYVLGFARGSDFQKYTKLNYYLDGIVTMGNFHLYFNTNELRNRDLRKDLSSLIKNEMHGIEEDNKLLLRSDTYLPKNMLHPDYYVRKPVEAIDLKKFKKKWAKNFNDKKYLFYFRAEYTSVEYQYRIKKLLESIHANIDVEFKYVKELVSVIKSKKYAAIQMAYFGVIADADGFLGPLNQFGSFPYGVFNTEDLLQELEKFRVLPDSLSRDRGYQEAFRRFESNAYFVPMHDLYFPVILKKETKLSNYKFRFSNFFTALIDGVR